jgi:hypothetical protein
MRDTVVISTVQQAQEWAENSYDNRRRIMTMPSWIGSNDSNYEEPNNDAAGYESDSNEGSETADELLDEVMNDSEDSDAQDGAEGANVEQDEDEPDLKESTLSAAKSDADRFGWNDVRDIYNFAVAFQRLDEEKRDRFVSYFKGPRRSQDDPIALAKALNGTDSRVSEVRTISKFAKDLKGDDIMVVLQIATEFSGKEDEEQEEIVKTLGNIARDHDFKAPVNRKTDSPQEKAKRVVESLTEITDGALEEIDEFLDLLQIWPGDK